MVQGHSNAPVRTSFTPPCQVYTTPKNVHVHQTTTGGGGGRGGGGWGCVAAGSSTNTAGSSTNTAGSGTNTAGSTTNTAGPTMSMIIHICICIAQYPFWLKTLQCSLSLWRCVFLCQWQSLSFDHALAHSWSRSWWRLQLAMLWWRLQLAMLTAPIHSRNCPAHSRNCPAHSPQLHSRSCPSTVAVATAQLPSTVAVAQQCNRPCHHPHCQLPSTSQ